MFLNDNQIYVTTKFMHSTQILVSVLAKKTFVCTLSASISDAASLDVANHEIDQQSILDFSNQSFGSKPFYQRVPSNGINMSLTIK